MNKITHTFIKAAALLTILFAVTTFPQVSNLQQKTENGRVIISFDNYSDDQIYTLFAKNTEGYTCAPTAYAITHAENGKGSIWWEPQLEGLSADGWKVNVTAKTDFNKKLGINWIKVEGGPGGIYYLSETEVTFDQYDYFCQETGYNKPSADFGRGKNPVINVNVQDALAFCKWLSEKTGYTVRLPEEDEWEFAAKGGKYSKGFTYSGSNNLDEVGWYSSNSGRGTHPVGEKKPNELGLYDMSGNVWEWTGTRGVIRGGSWRFNVSDCAVSLRSDYDPESRSDYGGFRLSRNK